MTRVHPLLEFALNFQTDRDEEKKIMIVSVDGGSDENLRYENTVNYSIEYFLGNDLDAFFLATNPPGQSTFNRAKHRMVKLNKELSGAILDHDEFGMHIDTKGMTDLDLKNFNFAGLTFAEIWLGFVMDGNPVVAEFIEDDAVSSHHT